MPDQPGPVLHEMVGQVVVLDVSGPYLYVGTLEDVTADMFVLREADAHYRLDSTTTSERYILETRKNGLRVNRARICVLRPVVMSISLLDDVVLY
jgi:hypothetical protein